MIYFICMVFVELWATENKRNIQIKNMWLRRELDQQPLASQRASLTPRLSGQLKTCY